MTPEQVQDLATRWGIARRAALARIPGALPVDSPEDVAALRALESDEEQTLYRVFDHGRRLGAGCARFHGAAVPVAALPGVLAALGGPCLQGHWSQADAPGAAVLRRPGCAWGRDRRLCDYWREATDGLVTGLCGGACHARHRSAGHGDGECRDVLYVPGAGAPRFGDIPVEMRGLLDGIRVSVGRLAGAVDVEFLGLSERVLFYRVRSPGEVAAGRMVAERVRARFPDVEPREWTHRAVLAA